MCSAACISWYPSFSDSRILNVFFKFSTATFELFSYKLWIGGSSDWVLLCVWESDVEPTKIALHTPSYYSTYICTIHKENIMQPRRPASQNRSNPHERIESVCVFLAGIPEHLEESTPRQTYHNSFEWKLREIEKRKPADNRSISHHPRTHPINNTTYLYSSRAALRHNSSSYTGRLYA